MSSQKRIATTSIPFNLLPENALGLGKKARKLTLWRGTGAVTGRAEDLGGASVKTDPARAEIEIGPTGMQIGAEQRSAAKRQLMTCATK